MMSHSCYNPLDVVDLAALYKLLPVEWWFSYVGAVIDRSHSDSYVRGRVIADDDDGVVNSYYGEFTCR